MIKAATSLEQILTSKQPVLVQFTAEWCQPCKAVTPLIESLAKIYEDRVVFLKLDVDSNRDICDQYSIVKIPHVLIFKDGEMLTRIATPNKTNLKSVLEEL